MFVSHQAINLLIIVVCLASQYFLSTRQHFIWGALLPIAFVIWRGMLFFTTNDSIIGQILVLILGLSFLLGVWMKGRTELKTKQQKELIKMQARDLV